MTLKSLAKVKTHENLSSTATRPTLYIARGISVVTFLVVERKDVKIFSVPPVDCDHHSEIKHVSQCTCGSPLAWQHRQAGRKSLSYLCMAPFSSVCHRKETRSKMWVWQGTLWGDVTMNCFLIFYYIKWLAIVLQLIQQSKISIENIQK